MSWYNIDPGAAHALLRFFGAGESEAAPTVASVEDRRSGSMVVTCAYDDGLTVAALLGGGAPVKIIRTPGDPA